MRHLRSRSVPLGFASAAIAIASAAVLAYPAVAQAPRATPPAQAAPSKGAPPPPQAPQAQPNPQPSPPRPYKPLAVKLPEPAGDPSFATFRQQLAEIAQKRDRAGLAKLMAKTFFWEGEQGDRADKRKQSIDNLAAAIGLAGKDPVGWDTLGAASQEPTLEVSADRQGVMCGPATPEIDEPGFEALTKDTGTDAGEWGYATKPGVDVLESVRPGAPVKQKLGAELVRVFPEPPPAPAPSNNAKPPPANAKPPATNAKSPQGPPPQSPPPQAMAPPGAPPVLRIVLPSGEFGYVAADALSPIMFDQLCYVKEGNAWKIAGYIGGDQ